MLNHSIYPSSSCLEEVFSRIKSPPSIGLSLSNKIVWKKHDIDHMDGELYMVYFKNKSPTKDKYIGQYSG